MIAAARNNFPHQKINRMKRIIQATACTAFIALLLVACNWFGQKPKPKVPFAGTWRVDSVVGKRDTGNAIPVILLAIAAADSTPLTFTFTGDSLRTQSGDSILETVAFKYESPTISILDSSGDHFVVTGRGDSSLVLTNTDSSRTYLTRQ
jgi:hypothetical protein